MKLSALLLKSKIGGAVAGDPDISGLSYDSRLVKRGHLFFAIKGLHSDGHDFLDQAATQGAVAAIVERNVAGKLPVLKQPSVVAAMAKISNAFFDEPSRRVPVIGITGTNGKTTTTYIIEAVLRSIGKTCGVIGTVNYRLGADTRPAPNTTPMSLDLQSFLAEAAKKGAAAVAMEVSSHALEQNRVDDVRFHTAVFTNLTQDHLDYHGTMESYFQAKRKLFFRSDPVKAVVNLDDPYGERLAVERKDALTFGANPKAQLRAGAIKSDLNGVRFHLTFPSGKEGDVSNNLLGMHNVSNCLTAAGALFAFGLSEKDILAGLNQKLAVPGRLERVEAGQKFVVAVDYAHTHDALAQVLTTLRNTGPKKLICVFGAGGDRDKTKRPKMGDVAVRLADMVFVTSDNPRTEEPKLILNDIEAGIRNTGKTNYKIVEDRATAIGEALASAGPGDAVLIAGKGHETYQIIGTKKFDFSDLDVARKILTK